VERQWQAETERGLVGSGCADMRLDLIAPRLHVRDY
jgi:hypothetical protein